MLLSQKQLSAVILSLPVALLSAAVPHAGDAFVHRQAETDGGVAFRTRLGEYVERYYGRAQHIVALEKVTLQPLGFDLAPDGRARRLEYELRVEWRPQETAAGSAATVVRQLLKVDGRAPRPRDEPGCMDPRAVSPEPLAMLLPSKQDDYVFTSGRTARVDGRSARVLDYRSSAPLPTTITWDKDCVTVDAPGRTSGRVWADPVTGEVLRVEERLAGRIDVPVPFAKRRAPSVISMTIERADTVIRYKPVAFRDPDETLMLPASIDSVTVIRDAGVPRLRTTQSFSNYRRFVTGSRILE